MAVPQPVAGLTHDVVLASGAPGNETLQGLMVAGGLKHYSSQPYTPFAPEAKQGEQTNRDFALPTVWELQEDFSGGVGKFVERKTEDNGYALSLANGMTVNGGTTYYNTKTGTTLYTGLAGTLMPPPALNDAGTVNNVKQFVEFNGSGTNKYYFVTSDATRKLYVYDATGVTPSEVTLPAGAEWTGAATQLYTDGASLYIAQGASKNVLTSTDGTTWVQYRVGSPLAPVNANFLCMRDDGALAYVAGATLTPGAGVAGTQSYSATQIGWTGTTATNMVFFKGALWIGKPEGLYSWYEGKVDKRFDAGENYSTSNFTKMAVHNSVLYFNVRNQLYFTDGNNYTQVFPNDAGGFANISCLFPTAGPLLIGAKLLTFAGGSSAAYFPQTVADDPTGIVEGVVWTNPTNATAHDNSYATAALPTAPLNTNWLKCTNFAISLPTTAVPVGVVVEVQTEWGYCDTFSARLVKGGVIGGDHKQMVNVAGAVWDPHDPNQVTPASPGAWENVPGPIRHATPATGNDLNVGFGGMADLWGLSLTRADVVASDFGVVVNATGLIGTVRVDSVTITVFYTHLDTSLEQLYMYWGPDAPGLNPLWSDDDGTHPALAVGATSLYDSTGNRVYFCCNDAYYANKIHYLSMSPRYWPASFRTDADPQYASSIELTEFSAGFRTVPKWWYQIELNVKDPLSTTLAKVEYAVDGGAWRWVEDEDGQPATLTLSGRVVGAYFPRKLRGVYISLRIHLWTTSNSNVAKITHVTLRGLTQPTIRYQFAFPANCDHTVPNLTSLADSGEAVRDFIRTAANQGYPCRFQDPWGKWHLVKFREPSPMDVITDAEKPNNNARQRLYAAVQCVLVEVDELDSYGDLQPWSLG